MISELGKGQFVNRPWAKWASASDSASTADASGAPEPALGRSRVPWGPNAHPPTSPSAPFLLVMPFIPMRWAWRCMHRSIKVKWSAHHLPVRPQTFGLGKVPLTWRLFISDLIEERMDTTADLQGSYDSYLAMELPQSPGQGPSNKFQGETQKSAP